ncbi:MAG: DUF3874 domain-containing protein [Prevotella sp.]|nr:DUF3874 domain-containing protein [Prevotella sp.]
MDIKNFNEGALCASAEETLIIEQFLNQHFLFRRNVLNGMEEFIIKSEDGLPGPFLPLTKTAINSIVICAKKEGLLAKKSPRTGILEYLDSDEVPTYNPIEDYLFHLPGWDGHNHVADLLARLPGLSTEQTGFLSVWIRSMVAHWLQMDTLHANECVPTLIGEQGCGKTTFLRRLLPPHLRQYYLDHLNLSNKFDKEMALTNNLLVNIDELDAITPTQHPLLKQTLSKNKVNGRPIFGAVQKDRLRFASFVATTNNRHPLTDTTGSRRYICVAIPSGKLIDNTGDINYEQLYAQILYELQELHTPYWYNNDDVKRIQELNLDFMAKKDLAEMVTVCFRKPKKGEVPQLMNSTQMLQMLQKQYPTVKINHSTSVHLGLAMKQMGYEHKDRNHVAYYQVIPQRVA